MISVILVLVLVLAILGLFFYSMGVLNDRDKADYCGGFGIEDIRHNTRDHKTKRQRRSTARKRW